MRQPIVIVALALAPALAAAQASAGTQTEARQEAQATVRQGAAPRIPEGFSAETRARLEAMLEVARRKQVPTEPMTDRMAEGQAKGATEREVVAVSAQVLADLLAKGVTSTQFDVAIRGLPVERALSAVDAVGSSTVGVRLGLVAGLTRKP